MGRPEDAAIEHLPIATRSKLRSTQILTSMSQIVSELLQNALDAGAGHIDIGVDCEEWTCWVRDDGSGMSKSGMDILAKGLEEGRYGMLPRASLMNAVLTRSNGQVPPRHTPPIRWMTSRRLGSAVKVGSPTGARVE
jgi:hypothetical protein